MRYIPSTVFALLVGLVLQESLATPAPQVQSPILEKVDVENIIGNPKAVEYHINCVIYNGPCDKIGAEVKRLLPEVGFQCSGCTPEQKLKLDRIEHHVQQNYPQAWTDMEKRYGGGTNEVASFSISGN